MYVHSKYFIGIIINTCDKHQQIGANPVTKGNIHSTLPKHFVHNSLGMDFNSTIYNNVHTGTHSERGGIRWHFASALRCSYTPVTFTRGHPHGAKETFP